MTEEIRARAEAATAGPWTHEEYGFGINAKERKLFFAYGCDYQTFADMDFVCHAREDIPALLDALEAKEQLLVTALETANANAKLFDEATAENAQLREQLTAAVEDIGKYAHNVHTCVSGKSEDCHVKDDHEWCAKCPSWQWRGRKEQNDG